MIRRGIALSVALLLALSFPTLGHSTDLAPQYKVPGNLAPVPSVVTLCASSDGSYTTVPCTSGSSGTTTANQGAAGTSPWLVAEQNLTASFISAIGAASPAGSVQMGCTYQAGYSLTVGQSAPCRFADNGGDISVRELNLTNSYATNGGGLTTGGIAAFAQVAANTPALTSGTMARFYVDTSGNLRVASTITPPTTTPTAIAASLPALGATPTLVAAAGAITRGFTIQNNSTAIMLFSVTAASGTTLTYANAIPIAVGASFTTSDWTPLGGVLQVQSATSTACAASATVPCAQGFRQ